MFENIITNPIDTPDGYINPIHGIALRGPMSQFFSGIYLKPLDDAISKMNVAYLRFQDDILILCKTKRQMLRARRRMMEVLHERRLRLSSKKTRMGAIGDSFHFLGVQYSPTRMENNTSVEVMTDVAISVRNQTGHSIKEESKSITAHQRQHILRGTPHPRTLRKARENITSMVNSGLSATKIKNYFLKWARWWAKTVSAWTIPTLIETFIHHCWVSAPAEIAASVLDHYLTGLNRAGRRRRLSV